jgi:hypothetical protein
MCAEQSYSHSFADYNQQWACSIPYLNGLTSSSRNERRSRLRLSHPTWRDDALH